MKRSDFLKATVLAPLVALFGWKLKPDITGYHDVDIRVVLPESKRDQVERIVGERGGRWVHEWARDVYISPSGREYSLELLEDNPSVVKMVPR